MKKSLGATNLAIPNPVWVIGTYDGSGRPNGGTASWGGHCCSRPPCLNVSFRKATYTYGNIVSRMAFTVNISSRDQVAEADYFGTASGRDTDKFAVTGLTPVRSTLVDAPYIAEFPLILECTLVHTIDLGLHTMFVGEIVDVKADETALNENGKLDAAVFQPYVYSTGTDGYFALGEVLGTAWEVGKKFGG